MTPTIPDEAVQAMPERIYAVKQTEGSNCVVSFDTPSLDYNVEYVRADLAAPFLQGVKVDSMDTAPKNGDEFLARCGKEWPWFSCFWDGSAFVHYDHTDGIVHYPATEWIPIQKRMLALTPSPRAQALEEAARKHLKWFERFICDQDELNSSTPRKVAQNAQNAAEELRAAIRALSSQDHADAGNVERDGWLPIETAPKDGTEFIGWDGKWPFRCSAGKKYELYPHMDGGPTYRDVWDGHYYDSLTIEHPTHWRPLPASPEVSG